MPTVSNLIRSIYWWFRCQFWIHWNHIKIWFLHIEQRNLLLLFGSFFKTLRESIPSQLGTIVPHTSSNWYSINTLRRFLNNHAPVPTTPPAEQTRPPVTPRTRRRAEIRDTNNILTDSPHRRRRIPQPIAPAPPPPRPQLNIPLPAQRHLLARQPLNPLMNVAHSLGPMNIAYLFLFYDFSYF
jgi:hypothetical protein